MLQGGPLFEDFPDLQHLQYQGFRGGVWAIRIRLQLDNHTRGLALFNLAIDSKLRGCDLVALRVKDVGMVAESPRLI